jgi:hypothetical protein
MTQLSEGRSPEIELCFDALEDALVKGWQVDSEGRVKLDALRPLLEASRAVLMAH